MLIIEVRAIYKMNSCKGDIASLRKDLDDFLQRVMVAVELNLSWQIKD
jgi:hypothetical protein